MYMYVDGYQPIRLNNWEKWMDGGAKVRNLKPTKQKPSNSFCKIDFQILEGMILLLKVD